MRVYLCGPINGCNDVEAMGWRVGARRLLPDCEIVDPMRRDYRGQEDANVEAIVQEDLEDIASCDVILVNATKPAWGTAMELHAAAADLRKRVVAFLPGPVSPWLRYHAEITATLEEACALIRSKEVAA